MPALNSVVFVSTVENILEADEDFKDLDKVA